MTNYPMHFFCLVSASCGVDTQWSTYPRLLSCGWMQSADTIPVGIPHQFGGPVRDSKTKNYSPEDLYGMALANCFVATFQVFAKNSRVTFEKIQVNASFTIDQNEKKTPYIKKVSFEIGVINANDKARTERLLQKVSENCIIINSVQSEKNFIFKVTEAPKND